MAVRTEPVRSMCVREGGERSWGGERERDDIFPLKTTELAPNILEGKGGCYDALREAMSRSLLHRLTPFVSARLRYNQRLLSSAVESAPSASQDADALHMTDNCIRRLKELHAKEATMEGKMLRLSVETGGCSGFQYVFLVDDKTNPDDRVFEREGVKLVVDNISYDFVKGATVDYVEELIRSAFLVTTNPSAVGGCSCKSSFMVK